MATIRRSLSIGVSWTPEITPLNSAGMHVSFRVSVTTVSFDARTPADIVVDTPALRSLSSKS